MGGNGIASVAGVNGVVLARVGSSGNKCRLIYANALARVNHPGAGVVSDGEVREVSVESGSDGVAVVARLDSV